MRISRIRAILVDFVDSRTVPLFKSRVPAVGTVVHVQGVRKEVRIGFFLHFPENPYLLAIVLYELLGTFWAQKFIK